MTRGPINSAPGPDSPGARREPPIKQLLASWLVSALLLPAPALGAVRVVTIAYGATDAQVLDLYVPDRPAGERAPFFLLAHGGLWQGGGRGALGALCRNIVERSDNRFACASMDYRLSQDVGGVCTGSGIPAYRSQVGDFAGAYLFLQNNANALGLDPGRAFIGGHSAGAQLAQVLNLRWDDFAAPCAAFAGCAPPLGAVGVEGIYDITAWNSYDEGFWGGQFACATRKAFGAPGPAPAACIEADTGARCWDAGSPVFLAQNAGSFAARPAGSVLVVHSPGDDWVDGRDATRLAEALTDAFPGTTAVADTTGQCGTLGHDAVLGEPKLAECMVDFADATSAAAESGFSINTGLSDAWFDPRTAGQGFFVTVWEEIGQVFVAWFTYDVERPPGDLAAQPGEPGHRWFTAQGTYSGDTAELDLYVTAGGVFDAVSPPAAPAVRVGSLRLRFSGCNEGVVSYALPDAGRSGDIPIQRIATDNAALCEALRPAPE